MEKELKIAELASIWGVSVPTTWNRIRKEGLTTFIKKNESNKEVNYVRVSDEIINQYVINDNNNVNNSVNNGYYEEVLSNNNVNNAKNIVNTEYTKEDIKDIINTITTVNNDYNNRLEQLTNRLINAESKQLLLEDKASREGLYINEINELKRVNNRYQLFNKGLITVIIVLLIVIIGYITFNIGLSVTEKNSSVETQKNPVQAVTPTPELSSKGVKK